MNIELHLDADPPYIVCPVDDPVAVEGAINPSGWCVGDSWWASHPEQKQPDGRWKLYVVRIEEYEGPPKIPAVEALLEDSAKPRPALNATGTGDNLEDLSTREPRSKEVS